MSDDEQIGRYSTESSANNTQGEQSKPGKSLINMLTTVGPIHCLWERQKLLRTNQIKLLFSVTFI